MINSIKIEDVWIAYRKAKADIFYEREHPNALNLCNYENNLAENLTNLFKKLQEDNYDWMTTPEFVGDYAVIPKGLDDFDPHLKKHDNFKATTVYSSPKLKWQNQQNENTPRIAASYRIVGRHSIDFHVVSTLWIMKVGYMFDEVLSESAYGARLRLKHQDDNSDKGAVNTFSIGSFRHYIHPYKQWRDNGIAIIDKSLKENKKVVALTADVALFYHSIDPSFLLEKEFAKSIKLPPLTPFQEKLTHAIIASIKAWTKRMPLNNGGRELGVPVGLPAARLIANVVLAELDRLFLEQLRPLYYGRYVDDLFIVLEDNGFKDADDVWSFLIKYLDGMVEPKDGNNGYKIQRLYLGNSNLLLSSKKQKALFLDGISGKELITTLKTDLIERSSEWRALPEFSDMPNALFSKLAVLADQEGESIDNLRKSDKVSLRRASIAIRLRDIEALENDLHPDEWKDQRQVFVNLVCDTMLVMPHLFEYSKYIPRILGLCVAASDFIAANKVMGALATSLDDLSKTTRSTIAGQNHPSNIIDGLKLWRIFLKEALLESCLCALSCRKPTYTEEWKGLVKHILALDSSSDLSDVSEYSHFIQELFLRDLARYPYRRYLLRMYSCEINTIEIGRAGIAFDKLPLLILDSFQGFEENIKSTKKRIPDAYKTTGLLFPTRPFTVAELYLIMQLDKYGVTQPLERAISFFRGFRPIANIPSFVEVLRPPAPPKYVFNAPMKHDNHKINIALTCIETTDRQWEARVLDVPDLSAKRYFRLNKLINQILSVNKNKPHYVVMPELSIPDIWFVRIAQKLANRGISLIAGVEYLRTTDGSRKLSNEVWASLVSDFAGFPLQVIYSQQKWRPSQEEEKRLKATGNNELTCAEYCDKPVVYHRDMYSAILICSELTNIDLRANLRGEIDVLFVPEWNQDIKSFGSLVEAAALDIHAFIVQCNNRKYGDGRIRAPYKDDWMRDVVKVKGGVEDYYVIASIDIKSLRRFQSRYHSSDRDAFKPTPDGFRISPDRFTL